MRTIKGQDIPQGEDFVKYPDGQIKNQTTEEQGTPVVESIYGDLLASVYKTIRNAGLVPNELPDNETNGYQFLTALKRLSNEINDLKQIITVDELDMTVGFNFDHLPNNYLILGQVSDTVEKDEEYSLTGSGGSVVLTVVSDKRIEASSYVLLIKNGSNSTIHALFSNSSGEVLNTSLGIPLSYNESSTLLYFSEGRILNNIPQSFNVQQSIRDYESDSSLVVVDAIVHKGKLICLVTSSTTPETTVFYSFSASDLTTVEGKISVAYDNSTVKNPYMYCDGEKIYLTNSTTELSDSSNDYDIKSYIFDEVDLEFDESTSFSLNSAFEKTTNLFINQEQGYFYTFISGSLKRYLTNGSAPSEVVFLNTTDGVVFKFNGLTYYSNGEIALLWNY